MSGLVTGGAVFVDPLEAGLLAACRGAIVQRFRDDGRGVPPILLEVLDRFADLARADAVARISEAGSANGSAEVPQLGDLGSAVTCSEWLTVQQVVEQAKVVAQVNITERAVRKAAKSGRVIKGRKSGGDRGTWEIEATSANAYAERLKTKRERSATA